VEGSLLKFPFTTGTSLSLKRPDLLIKYMFYQPFIYYKYKNLFYRLKPVLVYSNSSSLSVACIAAAALRIKVVWHIREYITNHVIGLGRKYHRFVGRRYVDVIIAITKFNGGILGCENKTKIVYNSVDLGNYKVSRSDNSDKNIFNICYLGGFAEIKGAYEFISSFSIVKKRFQNIKYHLIGNTQKSANGLKIKTLFKELFSREISNEKLLRLISEDIDNFFLPGIITDVPNYLSQMDLLVFPATQPHFGRPIIEAWAMGLPVIASDFGENSEIIEDGIDGLLVTPGDINALSDAIITIISDKKLAKAMGIAGRTKVEKYFSSIKNDGAIIDILDDLLASIK